MISVLSVDSVDVGLLKMSNTHGRRWMRTARVTKNKVRREEHDSDAPLAPPFDVFHALDFFDDPLPRHAALDIVMLCAFIDVL